MSEILSNAESEVIAKTIMLAIAQDNGAINSIERFSYKPKHLQAISDAAAVFFGANPELISDETIDDIACGEHSEILDKYGGKIGWEPLYSHMSCYFEHL